MEVYYFRGSSSDVNITSAARKVWKQIQISFHKRWWKFLRKPTATVEGGLMSSSVSLPPLSIAGV